MRRIIHRAVRSTTTPDNLMFVEGPRETPSDKTATRRADRVAFRILLLAH
jgi:hypothetical protein